jgi:hypothetical protein
MMILGETVGGRFRPFCFYLIRFPKSQNSCSKQRRCRAKARRYVQTHWDAKSAEARLCKAKMAA